MFLFINRKTNDFLNDLNVNKFAVQNSRKLIDWFAKLNLIRSNLKFALINESDCCVVNIDHIGKG